MKLRPRAALLSACVSAVVLVYIASSLVPPTVRYLVVTPRPAVQEPVQQPVERVPEVEEPPVTPEVEGPQVTPEAPLFVLVLSSLPRSGSTLMAQFLGTLSDSVVFFEPMWIKERTPCADDPKCVVDYVRDIFDCSYKQDFEDWLRSKGLFFNYYHQEVRSCGSSSVRESCLQGIDVRGLCSSSSVRVMKIIRTRISFLEPMLRDEEINFKVIYLTRDPRGSLNSIRKFGWNRDPETRCGHLEMDQSAFAVLSQMYPSRLKHLKHEDFCLDPFGKAEELMQFLFGRKKLPEQISNYLEEHMSSRSVKGTMSTFKNSSQEFEAWRYSIPEDELLKIEAEPVCVRTIQRMGHVLFHSIEDARNASVPLSGK